MTPQREPILLGQSKSKLGDAKSPHGSGRRGAHVLTMIVCLTSCGRPDSGAKSPDVAVPTSLPSVAPASSPAVTPFAIGGEVSSPRLLTKMELSIPKSCQDRQVQFGGGPFVYEATISENGDVRDVRAVKVPEMKPPCPEWLQSGLDTISHWKYEPARLRGTPVPVTLTITQIIDVR